MERGSLTFGDRLRAEREKRAIPLSEIAAATKIRTSYLEALERNAFDELPGMVFNRGFVRAYAEFLGADAEPLLKAFARELRVRGTPEPTAADDPLDELRRAIDKTCAQRRSRTPLRLLTGTLLLGLVALAGVGGAWQLMRAKTAAQPIVEPQVARVVAPSPPPPPEPLPSATPMLAPQLEPPPRDEPEVPIQPSGLAIDDFGVGKAVVQRALVGRSNRLLAGTDGCFWTLIVGGRPGDRIHHVWIHEGQVVRTFELPVDGPRWRTYSRLALAPEAVGRWAVEARTLSGVVLARTEFDCAGRI